MDELERKIADDAVRRLRERTPLVLSLTNTVAANFTANALLALGAKPAMVEEPEEAAELVRIAGAVLVNVGTVTARQAEAMRAAVASANATHVPWVLDPVAHHVLSFRRRLVAELLAEGPALVRGNAAEIAALPGAATADIVTLATGAIDAVRAPGRMVLEIAGGDSLMARVTATGCVQGAVCAAFCAVVPPYEAAVAASVVMKRAGERAAAVAAGKPGTFTVALIDALHGQDARATGKRHGQDARATGERHGQDARATGESV